MTYANLAWPGTRAVTLRPVESLSEPMLAEIVVVPSVTDVASPALPAELLIVAAVGSLEFQVDEVVKSC